VNTQHTKMVKIARMVPEISSQTDRQTQRHTDTQTHTQTDIFITILRSDNKKLAQ